MSTASAVSQELNVVASASIVEQPQQPPQPLQQPKGSSSTARNNGHRVISMASVASTGSPPSSSTHSLSNNDCLDPLSSKTIYFCCILFLVQPHIETFFETLFGTMSQIIVSCFCSQIVLNCPKGSQGS